MQTNDKPSSTNHNEIQFSSIPVHSTATLVKACVAASAIAALVLVTAILPAEYNIDPTGIGKALGLTEISQAALSNEVPAVELQAPDNSASSVKSGDSVFVFGQARPVTSKEIANAPSVARIAKSRQTSGVRSDTVKINIPAGKGLEYKLLMDEFVHLEYEWSTGGKALYFDFHGEPKGDTTGYFESFSITTADKMKGSLTTPFAGAHGWYWKNNTDSPIIVTLSTTGDYTIKG
ncbi:hypothetical protein [Shewanella violacea]|uniref:Uncharacterized protein n=1 Tax=Shewanella violacea (strain JCM 10179 / CIP 106290 / LMG 19151 / DSS12) TaxID=637905 RepID=D4ZL59_SHEVD|nr:hypothetical protein [Shewanella violacea]BAJ02408.1 conserved hypothetical protein [Shewanella violacea DSS12]